MGPRTLAWKGMSAAARLSQTANRCVHRARRAARQIFRRDSAVGAMRSETVICHEAIGAIPSDGHPGLACRCILTYQYVNTRSLPHSPNREAHGKRRVALRRVCAAPYGGSDRPSPTSDFAPEVSRPSKNDLRPRASCHSRDTSGSKTFRPLRFFASPAQTFARSPTEGRWRLSGAGGRWPAGAGLLCAAGGGSGASCGGRVRWRVCNISGLRNVRACAARSTTHRLRTRPSLEDRAIR